MSEWIGSSLGRFYLVVSTRPSFYLVVSTRLSSVTGSGVLSQSALQLNSSQEGHYPYPTSYHSNQTLALSDLSGLQAPPRGGQVGSAVHSYNQVDPP